MMLMTGGLAIFFWLTDYSTKTQLYHFIQWFRSNWVVLWRKYFLVFPLLPQSCPALSNSGQIASLVAKVTANKFTEYQGDLWSFLGNRHVLVAKVLTTAICSYLSLAQWVVLAELSLGCKDPNLARKPPWCYIRYSHTGAHLRGCVVPSQFDDVHW